MASQNKKCSARVTIDFSSDEGKDVDLVISLRRRGAQEGPPPTANEVAVSVASGSTCNWAMVRDDKATSKSSPDKQKETAIKKAFQETLLGPTWLVNDPKKIKQELSSCCPRC